MVKQFDKSKAFCGCQKEPVPTTFQFKDVPLSDSGLMVKSILVGVCDKCGSIVSIPSDSNQAIHEAQKNMEKNK